MSVGPGIIRQDPRWMTDPYWRATHELVRRVVERELREVDDTRQHAEIRAVASADETLAELVRLGALREPPTAVNAAAFPTVY